MFGSFWAARDFLNNREQATLIWLVVLAGFVAWKGDGIGQSVLGVLRALAPKLLLVFGGAAMYVTLLVLGANALGLWHVTALKETIYWYFSAAVILVANAITWGASDPHPYKRLLRRAAGLAIIFEYLVGFIIDFYVLLFPIEFVLVPTVTVLVGIQVVPLYQAPESAALRTFTSRTLLGIGLLLLITPMVSVLTNLDRFATREDTERLLVAPALALASIPFLWAVAWLTRREQTNLRERFRIASDVPA